MGIPPADNSVPMKNLTKQQEIRGEVMKNQKEFDAEVSRIMGIKQGKVEWAGVFRLQKEFRWIVQLQIEPTAKQLVQLKQLLLED